MQDRVVINPYTRLPVKKQGKITILTGYPGTGKTSWIDAYIKLIPLQKNILDFSGEYRHFGVKTIEVTESRSVDNYRKEFKFTVVNKWEKVIVFSEAGAYIKNNKKPDSEMSLIIKEARKRGNWLFLDFHSLSEINIDLLKVSDFLILKKQPMEPLAQIKKFLHYREIKDAYNQVMAIPCNCPGEKCFCGNRYTYRKIDIKKLTMIN